MEIIIGLTAIFAFVATNLDDMFLLAAFFAHPTFQTRSVVLGQYFGFSILLLVSSLAYFAQFIIPSQWISLLGVFPIVIGIRNLIIIKKSREVEEGIEDEIPEEKGKLLNKMVQVAAVTVANGGDNLGVYMPLFATMTSLSVLITAFVFFILVGVWCLLGYKFVNNRIMGSKIKKYGHLILPFVMIFIGVLIILKGWL